MLYSSWNVGGISNYVRTIFHDRKKLFREYVGRAWEVVLSQHGNSSGLSELNALIGQSGLGRKSGTQKTNVDYIDSYYGNHVRLQQLSRVVNVIKFLSLNDDGDVHKMYSTTL